MGETIQTVPAEIPLSMIRLLDDVKKQVDSQIEDIKEEIEATVEIMSDKKLLKSIKKGLAQMESNKGVDWREYKQNAR